ncbi:MAG: DnaJ domain-containing protein [Spirochaetes bacterium]|nr:DnaJ domain-containing protein [Spirochaetota bacterium]
MIPSCYDKNGAVIDFYTIFNLPRTARTDDIKRAFRELIKRYHPDTAAAGSKNLTEKLDLIVRGYRILTDEDMRIEYDRVLFNYRQVDSAGSAIISKKRIKYSATLGNMLKANLTPRGMKRIDILNNFGQDIEILVYPIEAAKGAVAYIDLPARMICPLCRGGRPQEEKKCYVCRGLGRIHTTSQLEVRIPPHVDDSTFIDVDLMHIRPDRLITFNLRRIRIKITVTGSRH